MYLVGEFSLLWKFALTGDFLNKNTSSTQRQNWRLLSHQTRIALSLETRSVGKLFNTPLSRLANPCESQPCGCFTSLQVNPLTLSSYDIPAEI